MSDWNEKIKNKAPKMSLPLMYQIWEFHDVGDKNSFKMISKSDKSMCGWIHKSCVDKESVIKPN